MSVVACGGGGGGGATPPVDPPIPDSVVQAAAKAEVRAYSTPSTSKAELMWADSLDVETGYRIDKSVNGTWTPVVTLASSTKSWTGTLDTTATPYRVVALLAGGKEIVMKSPAGLSELKLGPAPAGASIALSMAEPLKGEVKVSIAGAPQAQSAGFTIDLGGSLVISAVKPTFETTWNTEPFTNGSHKITALLQYTADTFVTLERAVTVANTDFTVSIVAAITATSPTATIWVVPSSRSGTAAVLASLSIDGKTVGMLTQQDCYYASVNGSCVPAFLFRPPSADYGFGVHTLLATVTDANGQLAQATGSMTKAVPLTITLTSPLQSRFTGTTLSVRGEVAGDGADTFGMVLRLHNTKAGERILLTRTGAGPFSIDVDMTGQPDGLYSLSAGGSAGFSSLASRSVLWVANPPMNYQWVKDLGDASTLTASGSGGVLLKNSDYAEWVVPGAAQAGVRLLTGKPDYYGYWKFAGDRWLGLAYGEATVYAWQADGSRQAVSNGAAGAFSAAGTQAGWLQNVGGQPTLWLSDLTAPAPVAIPLSGNPTGIAGKDLSLGLTAAGKVVAAYSELLLDAQGRTTGSAVFVYDAATLKHRQASDPATLASDPVTDGKQVAWGVAPSGPAITELWVAPVDGSGAPTRLSTSLDGAEPLLQWADGLLVWTESVGAGVKNIKVYRNGTTTTLITGIGRVAAVGSGAVAYTIGERLLVWTPDKGERLVLQGFTNPTVALTSGWLYFTLGNFPSLYRVPL